VEQVAVEPQTKPATATTSVLFLRFLAFLLCAFLAACSKSETAEQGATRFFNLCVQKKFAEAYQSTAVRFRLERSDKYFEARVRELGLDHDIHLKWTAHEPRGRASQLTGAFSIPVGNGKDVEGTLVVTMVEEDGAWRVLEVQQPIRGTTRSENIFQVKARAEDGGMSLESHSFLEPVIAHQMPTEEQLRSLVESTILKFDASVKAGNFQAFYDFVSDRWKYRGAKPETVVDVAPAMTLGNRGKFSVFGSTQTKDDHNRDERLTVTALALEFQGFIDRRVDLSPVKGKKLLLDSPAFITSGGILTMSGSMDTFVFVGVTDPPTPLRLRFNLQYVMESNAWRVFGISLALFDPKEKEKEKEPSGER